MTDDERIVWRQVAAYLKFVVEGRLSANQVKSEADWLLERVGKLLAEESEAESEP